MKKIPVGIWIDHENIGKAWSKIIRTNHEFKGSYMQIIENFANTLGEIRFIRVFVSNDHLIQMLNVLGKVLTRPTIKIVPCEARTYSNKGNLNRKTLVDFRLSDDIIATAYEDQQVKIFILVAGDKDYLPAIERLIKLNKKVIVIFDDDPNHNQTAYCIKKALKTEKAEKNGSKFVSFKQLLISLN